MSYTNLEERLIETCIKNPTDFATIQSLIDSGADINAVEDYDDSLMGDILPELIENNFSYDEIAGIIDYFVENGWDTPKYALGCIPEIAFNVENKTAFDITKKLLSYPLSDNEKDYDFLLELFGTEESYCRCCTNDHYLENLYYTMYEIIDARKNKQPHLEIKPFYDAIGLRIEKIVYFSETNDTKTKGNQIEYFANIGLVSGNQLFLITHGVNILFNNYRLDELPQIEIPDLLGKRIIGSEITDISFKHKRITKDDTIYNQPIIFITFNNDRRIKITHNWGENLEKNTVCRIEKL